MSALERPFGIVCFAIQYDGIVVATSDHLDEAIELAPIGSTITAGFTYDGTFFSYDTSLVLEVSLDGTVTEAAA